MKTRPPFAAIAVTAAVLLAPPAAHAQAQASPLTLAHRSVFKDDGFRNPFWPIGWQKADTGSEKADDGPQLPISPDLFNVTSIAISDAPLAVINGRAYAEGETISAIYAGQKIKILVVQITDGVVVLQYLGKKFTVLQKRPDMAPKQPDERDDQPRDNSIILH